MREGDGDSMRSSLRLVSAGVPPGSGFLPGDRPAKAGNGSRRRPTILVVEDELLIRMPVADYLRDCGYRVLEASTASEAVAVFKAGEPIEIVFSDINLPGEMNGFALAKWIRGQHPHVRVILTSGAASTAKNAAEMCEEGPFLEKPYSYEALVAHIRRLLSL